jgi:hypothetical protein
MPDAAGDAQLDLFVDGAGTALLNDVVAALTARDGRAAHRALDRLRAHDPGHPDLTGLGHLSRALRPELPAPASATALDALVRDTEAVLWPLVARLLGPVAAGAALEPVWRRLRDGASAAAREGAVDSGARLYWLGVARYHLGERPEAWRSWLRLAWIDPVTLWTHAPRWPDDTLRRAWLEFERQPGFDTPDEAAAAARWFPAWVVVRHRALATLLRPDEVPGTDPAAAAARCVLALLPLEARGLSDDVVRGRRTLQAVAPAFFRYYLRTVGR